MKAGQRFTRNPRLILLCLVVAPLLFLGTVIMWLLHTPNPRVKAPVAIDRNALLVHRYAGPCMNCHRIIEVGPFALNRENMDVFRLTSTERKLVLAGQRVDVLSLSRKLSVPAITRTDILPHPYVGVCCNCHLILDVHPTEAYTRQAMARATQDLIALGLKPVEIAWGGSTISPSDAGHRKLWGYSAIPLFLVSAVYVVARMARWGASRDSTDPGVTPAWFTLHQVCAALFACAAFMHFWYSNRGNNFLHLALVALGWLMLGGLALRYSMSKLGPQRNPWLLYLQRLAFLALLCLMVVGHFCADFF